MENAIKQIYKNRQNFILIGLTGKIGAGCTTAAEFMTNSVEEHNLSPVCLTDNSTDSERKKFIIHNFYKENWKPFIRISASDVISSFLIESDFDELQNLFRDNSIIPFDESFREKFLEFQSELATIPLNKENPSAYGYILNKLPEVSKILKDHLGAEKYRNYTMAYQLIGDNLRLYGCPLKKEDVDFDNIYIISERINNFIKIIKQSHTIEKKETYIAIDAFRNPFEAMYFKERYSAFYLMAINAENSHIEDRLYRVLGMSKGEIDEQEKKENPKNIVDKAESFISQNIKACIQKSDIHIANNGLIGNSIYHELYGQIIKYISLIQHPGLITPSLDEKMMQVAYTAKLNSACLSRQVGASLTNSNGSLKSIGWNSVAEGQTPCLLRNKDELLRGSISNAYSAYEKSDKFKTSLTTFYPKIHSFQGLNPSFCFKTIYNCQENDKNQVHTRSLHAEENAFLQIAKYGGEGIKGGTLYSTASPCELCSKKAYQLGIERVVYIDPYPGIAQDQILKSGQFPPIIELFKGAIGTAYHKLYEPIISYKDEIEALENHD